MCPWPNIGFGQSLADQARPQIRAANADIDHIGNGMAIMTAPLATTHLSQDRKSTRLNSSHSQISYAVFCLKKKKKKNMTDRRDNSSHIQISYNRFCL